jgi:hypothetical protein
MEIMCQYDVKVSYFKNNVSEVKLVLNKVCA